jgi:tetraacyldisaccharide 4'-kinase
MSFDAWLQHVWYGARTPPWWLRGCSPLYGVAVRLRRWLYAHRWLPTHRIGAPVVIVGNLTVGGTGKTPLVIWLVGKLRQLGFAVAVVTRGYGRRSSRSVTNDILRVDASCRAEDVGDEALLISRRTASPVYVCRDRVAAAQAAVGDGAAIVIADDGLQHLRLGRDAEIVVIDATRGFGNGRLLPAGPLREDPALRTRASATVLTGGRTAAGVAGLAGGGDTTAAAPVVANALHMSLEGGLLLPLNAVDGARALADFAGQSAHAVAGIGNPERFFASLRAAGLTLIAHPFPDHHRYLAHELRFGDGLPVIMTEKDAVKCQAFAPDRCWYLPVTASFAMADERELLRRIFMDARLLDILACPLCKGPLRLAEDPSGSVLVCRADRLAFPVRDGIPVMLEEAARQLTPTDPLMER